MLGVSVPGAFQTNLDEFVRLSGMFPAVVSDYRDWARGTDFPTITANRITRQGATYMITWEPFDSRKPVNDQPPYRLAAITAGTHDAYIARWASQIKEWGKPLFLRFAHEMNGNWYPWCERTNGNKPGEYVKAWRHVRSIFDQVKVTNATWIWCPNVTYYGSTDLVSLYPGDDVVDWLGIDGYNFGPSDSDHHWKGFYDLFGTTLEVMRNFGDKPLMIAETGSIESGGNKAEWITDTMLEALRVPEVNMLVWFNHQKRQDWRIDSSPEAQEAFRRVLANRFYGA